MNKYSAAAERIKDRVSMPDAIALYAPNPAPRHSRIPCPIHMGDKFNMWFSDWGYHCFVCGTGGDVIHFTQHIFGIPFLAALNKLNVDFNCGAILDRRPTLREQRDAQKRYKALVAKRKQQEAEKKAYQDLHDSLWQEWIRLDTNRREYAPQNIGDELHPLFMEALQKIHYQEHLIDTLL